MGQTEVLEVLKDSKRPLTTKEIHKRILEKGFTIGKGTVTSNIRKLTKKSNGSNQVIKLLVNGHENRIKYVLREKATKKMLKEIEKYPVWVNDI